MVRRFLPTAVNSAVGTRNSGNRDKAAEAAAMTLFGLSLRGIRAIRGIPRELRGGPEKAAMG